MRIQLRIMAWVVAGALVSACDASTDPDEESTDSPVVSSTSTDDVTLEDAPNVGTCWRIPNDAITDPDYWFDDSPQVPCNKPHNSETVYVFPLDEPTVEEATALANSCWESARTYVEVSLEHWVPWTPVAFLPSRQQMADGASFLRCEIAVPANLASTRVSWLRHSAEGVATTRADELLPCLDEHPDVRKQPFVSCAQPHRYEATGQLASLVVNAYPAPKVLRSQAAQCRDGLPSHQDTPQHAVTAAWDPPEGFVGGDMAGVCFVYHQDGSLLPARK
jgi:hypothetical protein